MLGCLHGYHMPHFRPQNASAHGSTHYVPIASYGQIICRESAPGQRPTPRRNSAAHAIAEMAGREAEPHPAGGLYRDMQLSAGERLELVGRSVMPEAAQKRAPGGLYRFGVGRSAEGGGDSLKRAWPVLLEQSVSNIAHMDALGGTWPSLHGDRSHARMSPWAISHWSSGAAHGGSWAAAAGASRHRTGVELVPPAVRAQAAATAPRPLGLPRTGAAAAATHSARPASARAEAAEERTTAALPRGPHGYFPRASNPSTHASGTSSGAWVLPGEVCAFVRH